MEENLIDFGSPDCTAQCLSGTDLLIKNSNLLCDNSGSARESLGILQIQNMCLDTSNKLGFWEESISGAEPSYFDYNSIFNNAYPQICLPLDNSEQTSHPDGKTPTKIYAVKSPYHNLIEIEESGRESLGILNISTIIDQRDEVFNNGGSNVIEKLFKEREAVGSPINRDLLYPFSFTRKPSTTSSCGSYDPQFFHSRSLEASLPSCISSGLSFNGQSLDDVLNEAFRKHTSNNKFGYLPNVLSTIQYTNDVDQFRFRLNSLPEYVTVHKDNDDKEITNASRLFGSHSLCSKTVEVPTKKKDDADSDQFNDSLYIEANHLASIFADSSVVENPQEEWSLDCTPQPEWDSITDAVISEAKCDTETIFKTIDKVFPANELPTQTEAVTGNEDPSIGSSGSSNVLNSVDVKHNLSALFTHKLSSSQASNNSQHSSNSKSNNAKEILRSLSNIFENEYRDTKQKLEGQNLLFSLAHILTSESEYAACDDSGHSSFDHNDSANEQDEQQQCEVLDLRTNPKISTSENDLASLDLCVREKASATQNKRLSRSFSSAPCPQLPLKNLVIQVPQMKSASFGGSALKQSGRSQNTVLKNDRKMNSAAPAKLKPKKVDEKKKGPLKAVIPIGNMAKRQSLGGKIATLFAKTPTKSKANSSVFHLKTSTPVSKPKLQPIAQSTPEDHHSNSSYKCSLSTQSKRNSSDCAASPVTSYERIADKNSQLSHSDSAPTLLNKSVLGNGQIVSSIPCLKTMSRRHSAIELKEHNQSTLRRSVSTGNSLKRFSAAGKVVPTAGKDRDSLPNFSAGRTVVGNKSDKKLKEKNSNFGSAFKPSNLICKLKKSGGKENVPK